MIHDLIGIDKSKFDSLPIVIEELYNNSGRLIKLKSLKTEGNKQLIGDIEKYLNSQLKTHLSDLASIKIHKIAAFAHRQIFDQISGHLSYTYVLKIDIKNFYESLTWHAAEPCLPAAVKSNKELNALIKDLYFHRGHLARGLMNSSLVAEFLLCKIDNHIRGVIHAQGLGDESHYSRYYDDFFISANSKDKLEPIMQTIAEKLVELGLKPNPDKTKMVRTNNTKILGLSLSNGQIHPPRYLKQQLYEHENRYNYYGESNAEDVYKKMSVCGTIKGTLHYIINNSSTHLGRYEYLLHHYNSELSRLHTLLQEMLEEDNGRRSR